MPTENQQNKEDEPDYSFFSQKTSPLPPTLLEKSLKEQIQKKGAMPFSQWMEQCLYHPQWGYYMQESPHLRVGKEGDFLTSVSVGKCFGLLIAKRIAHWWIEKAASSFVIVEIGAHDGQLCHDILSSLAEYHPDCLQHLEYHLVERSEELRKSQKRRFGNQVHCHASLEEIGAIHKPGFLLGNEIFDALPVDLVCFLEGKWQQGMVSLGREGQLGMAWQAPQGALAQFCKRLGTHFPNGWWTEWRGEGLRAFLGSLQGLLEGGKALFFDYGFLAEDYYHIGRSEGTLQTIYQHQHLKSPLFGAGKCDLTAHVDWSAVRACAQDLGWRNWHLQRQGSYLTFWAKEWLLANESLEGDHRMFKKLLGQFQTLTHPSMMGSRFQVMEMELP